MLALTAIFIAICAVLASQRRLALLAIWSFGFAGMEAALWRWLQLSSLALYNTVTARLA